MLLLTGFRRRGEVTVAAQSGEDWRLETNRLDGDDGMVRSGEDAGSETRSTAATCDVYLRRRDDVRVEQSVLSARAQW